MASGISSEAKSFAKFNSRSGQVVIANGRLELVIETASGLNPAHLRDLKTGRVYADAAYSFGHNARPALLGAPTLTNTGEMHSVSLKARIGDLEIEQTFISAGRDPDSLTEVIRLRNAGTTPLNTGGFCCGFVKEIHDGRGWLPGIANSRFCDVPYRRHPETGELCDFTIPELAARTNWYSTVRSAIYNRQRTTIHGAEGWAWYDRGNTLLITKYNPGAMEWSLLETNVTAVPAGSALTLRFGGAGRWKMGDPEGAARLEPGASFTFGATRYRVLDGDWRNAYAEFRRFTESKGHVLPANFDPPVHWNELYDNLLWWKGDNAENRKLHYQKKDMEVEAGKAAELGCQCLYLDPGWDTSFGSNLWADDRLGTQRSFVQWLSEKYGMALALHTPLAPWSDPREYPPEARRMDQAGKRLDELCVASPAYARAKIERLKDLCRHGAYFLMYDGSWFPGGCWDSSHGHSLPVTHQEHLDAIRRIAHEVHAAFPKVLIEQHDPMTGPGTVRYAPTYILHGNPGDFDELWGYEYMIDPMDDILSRRACSLYYVNLAYSIPIYLHIDLRKDNAHAMMFWWYASTCRHLGIGGKHSDPAVWAAHKTAMQTYLSLKRFYAQGTFYGLDETIHCHTLATLGESVLNCFNLEPGPVEKVIRFHPREIGLPSRRLRAEGADLERRGDEVILKVSIPANGHKLVRITAPGPHSGKRTSAR